MLKNEINTNSTLTPAMTDAPLLIGICGKMGSGKSTVAEHIEKQRTMWSFGFADPLKSMCMASFELSHDQMCTQKGKATLDPRWGVTPRTILQRMGTDVVRDMFPAMFPEAGLDQESLWIRLARNKVETAHSDNCSVVISDVRFPDEARFIHEAGGQLWRIDRPEQNDQDDNDAAPRHASENVDALAKYVDHVLANTGTIEQLHQQATALLGDVTDSNR